MEEKALETGGMTVAELVGLWLAEGWRSSPCEFTITNNCLELIWGSYETFRSLFGVENFRIYAYLPSKEFDFREELPKVKLRFYVDKRARKPYFILRLGNAKILREWKAIVARVSRDETKYAEILRGFFAGEGNIHVSDKNKTVRIAQKEPLEIVDRILAYYSIESGFSIRERAYVIFRRKNWEKLAKIKIADLHPDKEKKFWDAYHDFREWHHNKNHIPDNILSCLDRPRSCRELAQHFGRTPARLLDVLTPLKKRGVVMCYKITMPGTHYWVRADSGQIPISAKKKKILDALTSPKRAYEIELETGVERDSMRRNLRMLERLGFIRRNGKYWSKAETDKEGIVCDDVYSGP